MHGQNICQHFSNQNVVDGSSGNVLTICTYLGHEYLKLRQFFYIKNFHGLKMYLYLSNTPHTKSLIYTPLS